MEVASVSISKKDKEPYCGILSGSFHGYDDGEYRRINLLIKLN